MSTLVLLAVLATATASATLAITQLDFDSLDVVGADARDFQLTLAADDISPLVLAFSSDQNIKALSLRPMFAARGIKPIPELDIRWLIPWYQGGGPTRSIKHTVREGEVARDLVYELLVKDAQFVKNDLLTKRSALRLSGGEYIDVEAMLPVKGHRYIDAKKYPIIDADQLSATRLEADAKVIAWMNIHVPADTAGGNYTKKIGVYVDDALIPQQVITLNIKVLPLALEDSEIEHSIFYRGQLTQQPFFSAISSDLKTSRQLKYELQNMLSHGVSSPTIYQDVKVRSLFSRHMALREASGIDNEKLYYAGPSHKIVVTQKAKAELLGTIKKISDIAQTKVYMFAIDEATGERVSEQHATWALIRDSGASIFVTGKKGRSAKLGADIDLHVSAYDPDEDEAAGYHRHNSRVFVYAAPQGGVEDGTAYRFNYGFRLWQANYDGAMTYAYQAAMGSNVWNDFDSGEYRDHVFAYPTIDGLVDTRQWESYREAVDDLRYLATLNEMLSANNIRSNEALYREAVSWLRHARKSTHLIPAQARQNIIALLERMIAAGWRYE
ncbi:MAG: hypothetical protein KBT88_12940 [Gammaproteobacteria bacterium]|nr:hypothetical protein [Gammaproteobacteria bacterium]MBQ0840683.1 hypothetical protein [Gammaproteobacteria bacterium]